MLRTRYNIVLDDGQWDDAHFELKIDDQNRPFHLVFRRGTGVFGINSFVKGVWQTERDFTLPAALPKLGTIVVEVSGQNATILLGGHMFNYEMGVSQDDFHLFAASKNLSSELSLDFEEPDAAPPAHKTQGDIAKVTRIEILGQRLEVPNSVSAKFANRLAQDAAAGARDYVNFISSRPIAENGKSVTLLDIEQSSVLFALTGALLMPNAKILKLLRNQEQKSDFQTIVTANNLKGIHLCSLAEIKTELKSGDCPVVIQGGLAFSALGDDIAALPQSRREKLSIWSASAEVVPGNKVFPCANIQLSTPPRWTLNHNAAISVAKRRPGVDVTVAAYNAKDYLIECAESLLCKGRDDIRVIIVDDGSSDGSGEEAAKHFAKDPRVRVARKPNGGCASARNYGRLLSDATHIAFVDADDFVTDGFFGDLYDLALYSGAEITQGGFDFFDDSLPEPYYASYEEDIFKDIPRETFKGQPVIRLQSADIIKGQPTIWRKVYRRDFLDARDIYFPENVRAYDDYIFQMFSLTAARDILMMPEHKYHYRQHPAQDIKQGDERHFYMLYMFQMLMKRSIDESWPNFRPYAESIIDSISWSSSILRPDLVDVFLRASARFCVGMAKCYGDDIVEDLLPRVEHSDFRYHYDNDKAKYADIAPGAFWSFFNGTLYHPDIIRMRQHMLKAN